MALDSHTTSYPLIMLRTLSVWGVSMFLFSGVLYIQAAHASPVIRSADTVSLNTEQAIAGDFYSFGRTVSTAANISGDAYVIAGTLTQTGAVGADVTVVGGQADIHAPVGDDVRVIGGRVTIADKIAGDVLVVGGELHITSSAEIGGDVLFYGGVLRIEGNVNGGIFANAQTARIDARILKDADIRAASELVLGPRTDIGGNIEYTSAKDIRRDPKSIIVGKIIRRPQQLPEDDGGVPWLMPFLALVFSGLVLRYLFSNTIEMLLTRSNRSWLLSLLIGFAVLFVTPLIVAMLSLTLIGAFLGAFLFFVYGAATTMAIILSGPCVGGFLSYYSKGVHRYSAGWILLGTVVTFLSVYVALLLEPLLGILIGVVIVCLVLGACTLRMYEQLKD
jgi:hypothetical protein